MEHQLKCDSVRGQLNSTIASSEEKGKEFIIVNDDRIEVFHEHGAGHEDEALSRMVLLGTAPANCVEPCSTGIHRRCVVWKSLSFPRVAIVCCLA